LESNDHLTQVVSICANQRVHNGDIKSGPKEEEKRRPRTTKSASSCHPQEEKPLQFIRQKEEDLERECTARGEKEGRSGGAGGEAGNEWLAFSHKPPLPTASQLSFSHAGRVDAMLNDVTIILSMA